MAKTLRTAPPSERFDKSVLSVNGIACPFAANGTVGRAVKDCRQDTGWESIGKFREHVVRKHGFHSGCAWCGESWTPSRKNEAKQKRSEHVLTCDWERRGECNPDARHKEERITAEQHDEVDKIRKLSGERDLARLFEAIGKPVPACYHVFPLLAPAARPAPRPADPVPEPTTAPATNGHHQPSLLRGFEPPEVSESGAPAPAPKHRVTPQSLDQVQEAAQSKRHHHVRGADAAPDQDSGYGSLPFCDEPSYFLESLPPVETTDVGHPSGFDISFDDDGVYDTGV